ncbi:MAG: two-component sensor histidine kinase [Myxococcaceae bacterium]
MNLTRRLTFALTLIGCGVLVLSALLEMRVDWQRAQDESHEAHVLLGRVLNGAVSRSARFEGLEQALFHLDEANRYQQRVHVRWVWLDAPEGSSFAPLLPASALDPVREGHELFAELDSVASPTFVSYSPLALGGRPGAIELQGALGSRQEHLQRGVLLVASGTIALALLFFLAASAIGRRLVGRPVEALMRMAERVGKGDLDARVALKRPDELGRLAEVLNGMAVSLQRARAALVEESRARVAALEQLRHSERSSTVGKLAAGVAHELGTPLGVISLQAQSIAAGEGGLDEARADARVIDQQAKAMARIVRQLLEFSRRHPPERQPQPLEPVVSTALEVLRPVAQPKGVELRFQPAGAHVVNVDAAQVQQVVTNLVVNAVQASAAGQVVTLALDETEATAPADAGGAHGRWVRLVVKDEGAGIKPEALPHVFEPFFTTKDVGEGTGLGLSVSWGLVREHGGWMTAASEPGKGATFTVYLPVEVTT